ncbi:MAG: TonB-dependent receptor [Terracidiphilus sp.]|jgi:hypothetical protein
MKNIQSLCLSTLLGACSLGAWGQSTASLSGTVTDPSSAVVPNARVVVHSLATGTDRVVDTDSAGLYVVPSLQPGDYKVQATAAGFSAYKVEKVTLDVDRRVTLNMRLAVSSAGETVQVQSSTAQIESQTITVGQVIDRSTVQELPLNGRHFLDLTVLTPGGVVADTAGNLTSPSRGLGANSFITAGNREDSVNFQINGVNLNDISQNQITFQPSINTTSEFKIDNSTFSAEYGRSDGSIVNVATRSGTNKIHGEAFDYFRNDALDARNYFNRPDNATTGVPIPGLPGKKAPLIRDNFGAAAGGPIWKSHTFYFASYEGLRQRQGILQNTPVFSQAQQATIAANAGTYPAAALLAALLPLPNSGSNFVSFTPGPVNIDQFTGDGLHQFSVSDSLHGFYAFQKDRRTEPALPGDTIEGWGDHRAAHRQILTFNETHIFSPSFVNEARLGFNRISISFLPNTLDDPTKFGISDNLSGNVGLPIIVFLDTGLIFGGPNNEPQGRNDTLGVISDTATLLRGKSTIKFGGEFRRYLSANFAENIGEIEFANSQVPAGTAGADFQVDMAPIFQVQPGTVSNRVYGNAVGLFVQDNYKLTRRLTLEGGLRYEWNGTPTEGENRFVIFDPTSISLIRTGTNGVGAVYGQNNNIEPRVGFAYDVFGDGKTVVRGGYSYLVDQPVAGVVTGLASNPPFSTAVSYNNTTTPIPLSSLYTSAAAAGIAVANVNPNFKNAYIESYNLNVQHAFPGDIVASLGYYGTVGRHLLIQVNQNQEIGGVATDRPFTALSANSPIDPSKPILTNIAEKDSNSYSDYNAMWAVFSKNLNHGLEINLNYEWSKSMDLNSLGSQGSYILQDNTNPAGNYGLSDFDVRHHTAGTALYTLPFKGNRLVSGYQLSTIVQYQTGNPVNIITNSGYSGTTGVTSLVRPNVVGPISTHKSQTNMTNITFIPNNVCPIGTTLAVPAGCNLQIQAILVPAPTPTNPNATKTVYTGFGTMQRNAVTGPGFADVDLSWQKDTKIFEGLNFELRADAFDILNHPNFGQPSGNVQSTTFGQISSTRFATSDGGSSRQLQISAKFVF